MLGERKIRVGRGRVELTGIAVRVVSGLTLQISKHRHLPGALTATAVLGNKLVARQQVSAQLFSSLAVCFILYPSFGTRSLMLKTGADDLGYLCPW